MDKIVRNVIIFAALVLVVAAGFTIFIISRNSSINGINSIQTTLNGNNANGANSAGNINNAATGEVQDVTLSVVGGNYVVTPSVLKKGIPVRMTADLSTVRGCSRDVVIATFGVRKYVKEGDNIITFTPTQTGTIRMACSMNMYTGSFTVVDSDSTSGTGANVEAASIENSQVQANTQVTLSGNTNTASNAQAGGCGMSGGSGGSCGETCGGSSGGCGCGAQN